MKKVLTSLMAYPILAGGLIGCSSASNDRLMRGPHPFGDFGTEVYEATVNCTNLGYYDEYMGGGWMYLKDLEQAKPEEGGDHVLGLAMMGGIIDSICKNPLSKPATDPDDVTETPEVETPEVATPEPIRTLRPGQLTEGYVGTRGIFGIDEYTGEQCVVSGEMVRFTENGPAPYVSESGCYVDSF